MEHLRYDAFRIDAKELVGSRLRVRGRVCKLDNVQVYEQGDGTYTREFRPRAEVASDRALDTMRGIPLTVQHPDEGMVDSGNWQRLARGHVGDDPKVDGDHVLATLWVTERDAIARVLDETLQELSLGYYAQLQPASGTTPDGAEYDAVQVGHRYNHLALLELGQARGGATVRIVDGRPVLRLDAQGNAQITDTTEPAGAGKENLLMKITLKLDGVDHEVEASNDAPVQALAKEQAAHADALSAEKTRADRLEGERDAEKARADAEAAKVAGLEAELATARDPKVIADAARALADTMAAAKLVAGEDLAATGTEADIRRAALVKLGVTLDGKSDEYVAGRFDTLLEAAKAGNAPPHPTLLKARGQLDANAEPEPVLDLNAIHTAVLDGRKETA